MFAPIEAPERERPALESFDRTLDEVASTPAESSAAYALVGRHGERIPLPESLFRVLREAAPLLAKGRRVWIAPNDKELSTQQAADQLNISRPFLIKLLEQGEIPYTTAGRNRRVRFGDVIAYNERRRAERREHLRKLVRLSEDLGLYENDLPLASTRE